MVEMSDLCRTLSNNALTIKHLIYKYSYKFAGFDPKSIIQTVIDRYRNYLVAI